MGSKKTKKPRNKHIINELFSKTMLDTQLIKKKFVDRFKDPKRYDYIKYTPTAKLSTEEKNFFQKIFKVESLYKEIVKTNVAN